MKSLLRRPPGARHSSTRPGLRGFTLLEMLVSLIIGTIIAGGVMGLISVSMQHKFRIKEKAQIQPIMESAAQILLADPARATEGSVVLNNLNGSPIVGVRLVPVTLDDNLPGNSAGQLCRVMLNYKTGQLEFSLIIPNQR